MVWIMANKEKEKKKRKMENMREGDFLLCVCVCFWFGKRERNMCVEVGIYGVVVPFSFFLF